MKCIALGFPWAQIHPQSELVEFAVVEMEWQEEFRSQWSHVVKQWGEQGDVASNSAAAGPSVGLQGCDAAGAMAKTKASPQSKAAATAKGTAKATTKQEIKDEPGPEPSDEGDSERKAISKLVRDALKFKATLVNVSHNTLMVLDQITKDGKWEWARGEKQKELLSLLACLREEMSPWQQQFMVTDDWNLIRKQSTNERIKEELRTILELKKECDAVSKKTNGLLTAMKAMSG